VAIQLILLGSPLVTWAAEIVFTFTDPKGAPIADVVVSLIPLDAPAKITSPAEPALNRSNGPLEIAQSGQEFSMFVTPVVVGSTISFPNADKVGHQVYSLSPAKKFALPLYKPGSAGTVVFDRPGVVALGCNIHDWMLAYVVVLETPWFAKSALDGTAVVDVPAGRYRAEVWHPLLAKTATRELTIARGAAPAPQSFTLALKPDRRIRRTPAASGGGYK
jgi:plastocyanin